jgi:hypothetical protein
MPLFWSVYVFRVFKTDIVSFEFTAPGPSIELWLILFIE